MTSHPDLLSLVSSLLQTGRQGNSPYSWTTVSSVGRAFDPARLQRERVELRQHWFPVPVTAFHLSGRPMDRWDTYGARCTYGGFQVRAAYDHDHPYRPPRVTLDPPPSNRHYYDDGRGIHLCYTRLEEWNPRFTMATTFAVVFRFISDLHQGRAD